MKLSIIRALDIKADKWVIDYPTSLGNTISFDFTYLPNDWFKKIQKQITIESMTIKKPSIVTLNRYNYSLRRFFEFLKQYGIELRTFADLTHQLNFRGFKKRIKPCDTSFLKPLFYQKVIKKHPVLW